MEKVYVLTETRDDYGDASYGVIAVSPSIELLRDRMYERIGCDMMLEDEDRDDEIEGMGYGNWMNTTKTKFEGYMAGGGMYWLEIEETDYLK